MMSVRAMSLGFIAAFGLGCPGLLPGTDRVSDAALADPDRPVVVTDVPAAVDRPAVVVTDVPAVVDRGAPDTGGLVDTGPPVDVGMTGGGRCGDDDQACCDFGECRGNRVCLAEGGRATCQDCGDRGQPCCAGGDCDQGSCVWRASDATATCR